MSDPDTDLEPGGENGDLELARAFVAGDDAAFEQLYRRYARPIHDYALGIARDRSLAEDITQTTFIRAFEQRTSLREPSAFRAWLYRIAHNIAINQVTRAVHTDEIADDAPLESNALGPEQVAEQSEVTQLVWDAAASLDERQFTVLDLSLRKGLSSAEIGEVLGLDGPQASLVLHRAREALGNAVRYLVVARRRRHCDRLAELVPAGIRSLTAEQRATVDRHMRRCSTCQEVALVLTDPAQLFAAIPLVALPTSLLEWHGHPRPASGHSSPRGRPRGRIARFFTQPGGIAAAGAVAVASVAVVTAVAIHHPQHRAAPPPAPVVTTAPTTRPPTTGPIVDLTAERLQLAQLTSTFGAGAESIGPVVSHGHGFGLIAHANPQGAFAVIYTFRSGGPHNGWQRVSTISLSSIAGLAVNAPSRVHLTGAVDFLVPIQFADSAGAAIVTNAPGRWIVVPFESTGQTPLDFVMNPVVQTGAIESTVAPGAKETTYRYNAKAQAFEGKQ